MVQLGDHDMMRVSSRFASIQLPNEPEARRGYGLREKRDLDFRDRPGGKDETMGNSGPAGDDRSLEREGGVFVPSSDGRDVGCGDNDPTCPEDEWLEDPITDEHVPGTVDDRTYDYGTEDPEPADQALTTIESGPVTGFGDVGETGFEEDRDERDLGELEERDLWRRQRPLIEEDVDEVYNVQAIRDEELPAVERAIGEDAAGPLVDTQEGTSSIGSTSVPEQGGFPEEE
jgi:hypothetical protein